MTFSGTFEQANSSTQTNGDFRLLSRKALDMLATYPEHNLYLRGLIPMIGLRHTSPSRYASTWRGR